MVSRLHAYIGTFRQLEILLAVFEHGSISAAADALFLTQPTVSMQLKKLTEAVGLTLYQKNANKLLFTDAGMATVQAARDILRRCEELDMELSSLKGLQSGTLRITCATSAKYFIPHLIGPFCKRYPGIDIQFKIANRQQVIDRMEEGLDDFYVFSHLPRDVDLETIEFMPNYLVAIAANDHPFAQRAEIGLAEFCEENFLIREMGSGTRFAIEEFFKTKSVTPNVRMTIDSNEAIVHSVLEKLGVSILSSHILAFGESYDFKVLNVNELPIQTNWSFAWTKSKKLSPIANVFLDYVRTEGKNMMIRRITA